MGLQGKVDFNKTAWANGDVMLKWFQEQWAPAAGLGDGRPKLVVMDKFKGNLESRVLECLRERGVLVAVIPGGCTSLIQPLDVGWNAPFKRHVEAARNQFFSDNLDDLGACEVPCSSAQSADD